MVQYMLSLIHIWYLRLDGRISSSWLFSRARFLAVACFDLEAFAEKMCIRDRYSDRVRVSVFNTGEPIPDKDIENIWNKFYKVDKARTCLLYTSRCV